MKDKYLYCFIDDKVDIFAYLISEECKPLHEIICPEKAVYLAMLHSNDKISIRGVQKKLPSIKTARKIADKVRALYKL